MEQNYKLSIFTIEEELNRKKYEDLLQKKWSNNVFYSIAHLNYFQDNIHALKFFIFEKKGEPIILMPIIFRNIVINGSATPYYDVISPYGYNGPLLCDSIEDHDIIAFWAEVDQWYKENQVISEFIRFSLNDNYKHYSGNLIKSLANIKGKLHENTEDQWKAFLPKVRNNYRKAVNSNLRFKIYKNEDLSEEIITIFYTIYISTMCRNKAETVYFFPKSYFLNLINSNNQNLSIAVVYHEEIPISVELNIHYDNVIYAFLGGTDSNYFQYRPNDFLRVEIINWAISKKRAYYVLGGGIKNGDGLYKSKKAFFPKDNDAMFYTGRKIINRGIYENLSISVDNCYLKVCNYAMSECFFPFYRRSAEI